MVEGENTRKEYIKFGLLLAGIASLSFAVANFDGQVQFADWMQWFMGLFLLIFGSFKLVDYEMFVEMFRMYDPWAKAKNWYGWAYPFIEIALGMLYISNSFDGFRELATIIIFGVGAKGVWDNLNSHHIQCACLGNVIKLPLSRVTLIEDVGMVAMATIMLII